MGLFGIRLLERKRAVDPPKATEEDVATSRESYTPLMLLVPDAAGLASYRLHIFTDVESATVFIRAWFRPGTSEGVIAFWALHAKPELEAERPAEAVALIRDTERPEVFYLLSLCDMKSVQSWLRLETERGLDLGLVMAYWTVPITIETNNGAIRLTPSAPQPIVRQTTPKAEAVQEPSIWPVGAGEPEEPVGRDEIDVAAAEETHRHGLLESLAALSRETEAPAEASQLEEATDRDEEFDAAAVGETNRHGLLESLAALSRETEAPAEASQLEEAADRDEEFDAAAVGETNSHELLESLAAVFPETEVPAEASEHEGPAEDVGIDGTGQVRRWERREAPFRGFGSPEGKF